MSILSEKLRTGSRRATAGVGLALLLVLVMAGCRSTEERLEEHRKRAAEYVEAEQWNEAKIELWNVLQLEPDDAQAHYDMATTLWALREYPEARWQYLETVRLDPTQADARLRLAQIEMVARRPDAALEQVDALLEQSPENVEALLLRAAIESQRGNMDREAFVAEIDRAIEIDPMSRPAWLLKARTLEARGDDEAAEAAYRKVVEIDATVETRLFLAQFYGTRQRYREAEKVVREAIADSEGRPNLNARLALTNLFLQEKDNDSAEKALLEAREAHPDSDEVLIGLSRFYVSQGRSEEAEQQLLARIEAKPDEAGPLLTLADFYRREGQTEKARETVQRAAELDPQDEIAALRKVEYLLEGAQDDPAQRESARREIDAILERSPSSIPALYTEALLLILEGNYERATQNMRRVVEEAPSSRSYMVLGTALMGERQFELARSELLRSVQLDARNWGAQSRLASVYLQLGDRELAVESARAALEGLPNDPRPIVILATALVQLDRRDEAREALARLSIDSFQQQPELRIQVARLHRALGDLDKARFLLSEQGSESCDPQLVQQLVATDIQEQKIQDALDRTTRAIERCDDDAPFYAIRGNLRLRLINAEGARALPEETEADLQKAIELDPSGSTAYASLAAFYQLTGKSSEAISTWETARANRPEDASVRLMLGTLYEQGGRLEDAMQEYDEAIRLDSKQAVAMNNLAWLLAELSPLGSPKLDRALELAQDARELLPDNGNVADTLAWVMVKKNLPTAAIPLLQEALVQFPETDPARGVVRYHLARAYEQNGQIDEAVRELRTSLEESPASPTRPEAEEFLRELSES